ncbi:hypothetical protein HPB50_000695 [Hyalomma asiaticum]|uniref:Uncharacterized protein n=1 Tax=Hyalomma asiaticum TaxID=266040 RepID=A0ACB7SQ16_HYAAI|nr:hypothetical protein HPB50_000695 [Hyalomma asiaticum]
MKQDKHSGEVWRVLRNLKDRCHRIDDVKLLTDLMVRKVQKHFHAARIATGGNGEKRPFPLSSFLETHQLELDHLRQVADFILALLLPSEYALCISVRHLLREILACLVFQPTVDLLTDPDYINQKLIAYLQWLQAENEKHSRTYAYAETWEDFIFVIDTCTDIQDLKRMRCITQTLVQVFAFSVLMESPVCREYLARFLQAEEVGKSLLAFWQDIENMKLSSKDEWHQLGNEIYQTYIKRPRPGIRLSKGVLKGIEAFIMANKARTFLC